MVEVQISYSSCFLNEDGLVLLMDKESQLMFKKHACREDRVHLPNVVFLFDLEPVVAPGSAVSTDGVNMQWSRKTATHNTSW